MKKWIVALGLSTTLVAVTACGTSEIDQVDDDNDEEEVSAEEEDTEETGDEEDDEDEDLDDEDSEDDEGNGDMVEDISIGDTMNFDGLEITLNDAYTSGGSEFESPDNDHFVILDLSIENTTDEPADISTMLQMSLQDDEGYTHDVTIFTETDGSLDGEIGPERDNRGEIAFDVDESEAYEFIFENPFTSGQAIWTITDLE
ncbi:DUF4352 domain-containing protein [Natribacillus halophilus]|uniref:DUF4352 domain-containing protein n=1 Tax=Natribacillus halophilus TaxID=549003 RepID=A0A1G8N3M3_9BACI|nr:DUF4352 domain-containing protein [Natribacillus halophilus]SDI74706.1 protein of unknown function [Natribacillus halophilus]